MRPILILKLTLTLVIPISLAISCATTTPISTDDWWERFEPGHTREEILSNFDLHRGKWWNYYARGCWLEEGGFWADATSDLEMALKIRSQDQRAARSYGMHFWDYFARRELGVCYYNMGRYEEAIVELEASLSSVDSAKAKFYLNKARTAILAQQDIDKEPPTIVVTSFKDGDFVNSTEIDVKGEVRDNYFSNAIWINDRKLFTELASKGLPFDRKIPLVPGENAISIKASDLVGNEANQTMRLTVDMRPPVILLDEIPIRKSIEQRVLTLKGTIVDDSGIERFWINDNEIKIEKGKDVAFNEQVDITAANKIVLRALDVAGNNVHGEHPVEVKAAWLPSTPGDIFNASHLATHNPQPAPRNIAPGRPTFFAPFSPEPEMEYPRLASIDNGAVRFAMLEDNQSGSVQSETDVLATGGTTGGDNPPKINTDLKSLTVYDKYFIISGEIQDDTGIARVFVNDDEIQGKSSKHLFFNHILTLNEGDNLVIITAEDTSGNKGATPATTIKKGTYEFLQTDARYTVALMPLKRTGIIGTASDSVYPTLLQAFEEDPRRFNFVERDEAKLLEILNEQKISNSELASPDAVIKIGKIRAAEGMLFGMLVEDEKSISVTLNLVDTETTRIIATADVYEEEKGMDSLCHLMRGLVLKIKQRFPMLQGSVVYVSPKGFFIDVGSNLGATLGMKLLMFREINLGSMTIKEPLDIVARVTQVDKDASMASIVSGDPSKIIQKDLVITK